jgi:hypothetical protein
MMSFVALVLGAYGWHGCNEAQHAESTPDASVVGPDASDVSAHKDVADAAPPYDSGLLHANGPLTFRLKSGNEPPDNRPNAWAYIPTRFDPRKPLHVVVLFHGFRNCIYSYTALGGRPCEPQGPKRTGYDLVNQTEKGESGAIVVVPEIAFNGPSSDPIKLGYKGALRAFLEELLDVALAPYIGEHRSRDIERLALGASSGGYQAMLPALEVGGMKVTELYFFDALYVQPVKGTALGEFLWHDVEEFDPARPVPKRFGVIYTDNGGATTQSVATMNAVKPWLADAGRADWGGFEKRDAEPTVADLSHPIAIVFSGSEHDKIMHRDFWTVMKASGL